MSIDATRWAWKQRLKSNHKIILLSLADRAGENHDCYPSLNRLVLDTGQSKSSIQRGLIELERRGLISKKERITSNGNTSNIYTLLGVEDRYSPPASVTPPIVTLTTPDSQTDHPPIVTLTTPDSQTDYQINQSLTTTLNHHHQSLAVEEVDFSVLTTKEIPAAKKLLEPFAVSVQIEVMAVLTAMVRANRVKSSKIGYLRSIVQSVNDGSFTPLPAKEKPLTTSEIIAKEEKAKAERDSKINIDNAKYFEELEKKYGYKAKQPKEVKKQ